MKKKKKTPETLDGQLRQAVLSSGQSLYAIARATGLMYSGIHGFARGNRSLTLESAGKIAAYLNLELTQRKGK